MSTGLSSEDHRTVQWRHAGWTDDSGASGAGQRTGLSGSTCRIVCCNQCAGRFYTYGPAEMLQAKLGITMAQPSSSYRKPYNSRFDIPAYPHRSTREHVCQFVAQLGEAADNEVFRVRLFSLSLTGAAFAWYAVLPPTLLIHELTWNKGSMNTFLRVTTSWV